MNFQSRLPKKIPASAIKGRLHEAGLEQIAQHHLDDLARLMNEIRDATMTAVVTAATKPGKRHIPASYGSGTIQTGRDASKTQRAEPMCLRWIRRLAPADLAWGLSFWALGRAAGLVRRATALKWWGRIRYRAKLPNTKEDPALKILRKRMSALRDALAKDSAQLVEHSSLLQALEVFLAARERVERDRVEKARHVLEELRRLEWGEPKNWNDYLLSYLGTSRTTRSFSAQRPGKAKAGNDLVREGLLQRTHNKDREPHLSQQRDDAEERRAHYDDTYGPMRDLAILMGRGPDEWGTEVGTKIRLARKGTRRGKKPVFDVKGYMGETLEVLTTIGHLTIAEGKCKEQENAAFLWGRLLHLVGFGPGRAEESYLEQSLVRLHAAYRAEVRDGLRYGPDWFSIVILVSAPTA